jgi:hypothetical protein
MAYNSQTHSFIQIELSLYEDAVLCVCMCVCTD